nr:hypothetical protein [Tanacetum cinerariifolium]
MSSFNQRGCYGCGGTLDDLLCGWCTYEWCGNNLRDGFCSFCNARAENSFIYHLNPTSFDNPPDFSYQPPQPQYETYSCELCGNDYHYGYDCPPRFPLVYEQEPSYNQNFGDNSYPQNSPSFPQQYLYCENCGGPHESFQCQPRNQNYFKPNPCYNPNSYDFDQPTQTSIDHQPPKEISVRELLLQEKLHKALQAICEKLNQQEQVANISTHTPEPSRRFNFIYDDDEESIDSLIMGNEELNTIPEKESDEFIKSSVEDLVPILSEFEDTSGSDNEYDLSSCDDFSPIDDPEGKFVTFSNPLFDSNDDFTSSDDESLSDEDVPEDKVKIYSNPLFEFDDEYIFSDVNPLFDEVLENIENKDSYLDEPDLLVTPLSDANEDECLDPGGDFDKIELLLHHDPSTLKMSVASILEGFTDEPPLDENDDLFYLDYKENK